MGDGLISISTIHVEQSTSELQPVQDDEIAESINSEVISQEQLDDSCHAVREYIGEVPHEQSPPPQRHMTSVSQSADTVAKSLQSESEITREQRVKHLEEQIEEFKRRILQTYEQL